MPSRDGVEIERKYLLSALPPAELLGPGVEIQQGYIDAGDPEIRVRRRGPDFFLTIKSGAGVRRDEHEVRIPEPTFEKLWPLTEGARVEKTRYLMKDGDDRSEIDAFAGPLSGLYLAEIELPSETRTVRPPAFLPVLREVTSDPAYKNKGLATRGLPSA